MPREMSFLDYQNAIEKANRENQELENTLSDRKRMKKELKDARKKKRKLEKQAYRDLGAQAIQNAGYNGPVLILLNQKGEKVGYMQGGQAYRANPQLKPPMASPNVKGTWKLPDCEVEEVHVGGGRRVYDVYIKKGGHTRVQRIYPYDAKDEAAIERNIRAGNSPVGNSWEDGMGRVICWENATPVGGPTIRANANKSGCGKGGCNGNKCLKGKKKDDKPQSNDCLKRKPKEKKEEKPQSNQCLKRKPKDKKDEPVKPQSNQNRNKNRNRNGRR